MPCNFHDKRGDSAAIFTDLETVSHSGFVFQCEAWRHDGACHCNSHKRSDYWKILRDSVLLGGLQTFKLELSDVDSHLKNAGS